MTKTIVRVAFLAHEVKSILTSRTHVSRSDREILEEAAEYLEAALEGGRKLASRDFNAAMTRQISAFGWMANVLAVTEGRENANSSEEVANLIGGLLKTLRDFSEGKPVPEEDLDQTALFFTKLRDIVLQSQRQPLRPPELKGVA